MNIISLGNALNSVGQFLLFTLLVKSQTIEILTPYLLTLSVATISINHFRTYIPSVILKSARGDIVYFGLIAPVILVAALINYYFLSLIQSYVFKSDLIMDEYFIFYIIVGFLQVVIINLLLRCNLEYYIGCTLGLGGLCTSILAISLKFTALLDVQSSIQTLILSFLIQCSFGIIVLRNHLFDFLKISQPRLKIDKLKFTEQLTQYIKFYLYEIPTRPIPYMERAIAENLLPGAIVAIEIIQRFFVRPFALLMAGDLMLLQKKVINEKIFVKIYTIIQSLLREIYLSSIKYALLSVIIGLVLMAAVNKLIFFDIVFIIGIVGYYLHYMLITLSDLTRKKYLSELKTDITMSINLVQGIINCFLLYLCMKFNLIWSVFPICTVFSVYVSFTLQNYIENRLN